ncbi:MAG: hypothetical protein V3T17_10705 [Pseudomonadales bacterium]
MYSENVDWKEFSRLNRRVVNLIWVASSVAEDYSKFAENMLVRLIHCIDQYDRITKDIHNRKAPIAVVWEKFEVPLKKIEKTGYSYTLLFHEEILKVKTARLDWFFVNHLRSMNSKNSIANFRRILSASTPKNLHKTAQIRALYILAKLGDNLVHELLSACLTPVECDGIRNPTVVIAGIEGLLYLLKPEKAAREIALVFEYPDELRSQVDDDIWQAALKALIFLKAKTTVIRVINALVHQTRFQESVQLALAGEPPSYFSDLETFIGLAINQESICLDVESDDPLVQDARNWIVEHYIKY